MRLTNVSNLIDNRQFGNSHKHFRMDIFVRGIHPQHFFLQHLVQYRQHERRRVCHPRRDCPVLFREMDERDVQRLSIRHAHLSHLPPVKEILSRAIVSVVLFDVTNFKPSQKSRKPSLNFHDGSLFRNPLSQGTIVIINVHVVLLVI